MQDVASNSATHASSNRCTRYASAASCNANNAELCHRRFPASIEAILYATSRTCRMVSAPSYLGYQRFWRKACAVVEIGVRCGNSLLAKTAAWPATSLLTFDTFVFLSRRQCQVYTAFSALGLYLSHGQCPRLEIVSIQPHCWCIWRQDPGEK